MSLHEYAGMLFRSGRILQFQQAITDAVRPGDRVLEIGTGLGTYAFFAARAGAAEVFAIDSDPVVHLAQELSVANGFDKQIEFLRGTAPGDLPEETFDLIIFEDYPTNFLGKKTHRLLRALEENHLAAGGRFLPGGARLSLAPVLAAGSRDGLGVATGRELGDGEDFGLDWGDLRTKVANTGLKVYLPQASLAAVPCVGARLPVLPAPSVRDFEISGEWSDAVGAIGGLVIWFDLDLGDAGWVSNEPKESPEPWGQWFLPLDPPIIVGAGAPLKARVWWEELDNDTPGWMGWECSWEGNIRRGHEFAGLPISPADLGIRE